MLDKDRELLVSLIREYSCEEFISTTLQEMERHIDDLSDLGMRDKAVDYSRQLNKYFKSI